MPETLSTLCRPDRSHVLTMRQIERFLSSHNRYINNEIGVGAMTTAAFEYWQPGSEERQLRIFISHRFGKDQELYDQVVRALEGNGFSVQDMSLSTAQAMAGPRGGDLPRLNIQAEIAARIYTHLVGDVADLGLPHAVCERSSQAIVANLIQLINGRPNWGVRQEETEANIRFRGPPEAARTDVLRRFPFQPRLPPRAFEPVSKRGFWSFLGGDKHPS